MSGDFKLLAACQRMFNVTPEHVDEERLTTAQGVKIVEFLATLRNVECPDLADIYRASGNALACGMEDLRGTVRWAAVREYFEGEVCVVVTRLGSSCLERGTFSLHALVFRADNVFTRRSAVEMVKLSCLQGEFDQFDVPD